MYKFLILAVLISGCATPREFENTAGLTDGAVDTAGELSNGIPPSLLLEQKGPTVVPKSRELAQSTARRLWNRDRSRLRACVATHGSLVGRVAPPIPIPEPS